MKLDRLHAGLKPRVRLCILCSRCLTVPEQKIDSIVDLQVLPCVILACAKDAAFQLQLCQLLINCTEARPVSIAAFHAVLPLLKEDSSAGRCLAGGLRSMLAASAAQSSSASVGLQSEAQVRLSPFVVPLAQLLAPTLGEGHQGAEHACRILFAWTVLEVLAAEELACLQGNAGAEPAAKRRRIDAAGAPRPLSQQVTRPEGSLPDIAAQHPEGSKERAMLVKELVVLAKQTDPAGERGSTFLDQVPESSCI